MRFRTTAFLAVAAAVIVCTFTTTSRAQIVRQLTETSGSTFCLPRIDGAGDYAFYITSSPQLSASIQQIGRFDAATGLGELLTAFPEGVSDIGVFRMDVDDAGEWIAFVASGDLTGQNHDRGYELFVMRADGTGLAQITNDPSVNSGSAHYVAISGDGSKVAFVSYADPLGTNPAHVQNLFAVNRDGTGLVQLTQATAYYHEFYGFSISDDGERIAFSHNGDLTGGNPGVIWNIFTVESDGSNLNQITSSSVYNDFTMQPEISGSGSKIVFHSGINPTGANPDRLLEVFLVDWAGTNLQQLTSSAYESSYPDITDDETTVVFLSSQNLSSQNADHNFEVWKIQSNGSGLTPVTNTTVPYGATSAQVSGDGSRVTFTEYTHTIANASDYDWTSTNDVRVIDTGGSNFHLLSEEYVITIPRADLTADGTRVVFLSAIDLLGGDPDGSGEIYRIEADGTGLAQVTSLNAGRVFLPSVAADRTTIVFSAAANPLGTNADLSEEIFRIQADGTGLAQLTSSPTGKSQAPRISADGQVVVFQSTANLTGSNADGTMEVFKIAANGTGLLQLTSGGAGASNSMPRIDDSGTWVAYSANGTHIWRVQTNGTGAQRLTPAGQFIVGAPDISGSGGRIVWHSNAQAGGANPERNDEIFVYDTTTSSRIQLTSTDSHNSLNPRLSRDGTWVYFGSHAEFHEDDPDYPFDVQRIRADGTGAVERVGGLRISDNGGGALAVDYDGDRAVLAGSGDWAGSNPDGGTEVFLFDRSAPTAITIGKASPTLVSWIAESGPIRYDVIRGDVANLQDGGGGTVDLGAVECLEDDSPDADTEGFEDAVDPAVGHAYFFLYRGSVGLDVGPGSFGTAKDGRVRVAGIGNCAS